MDNLERWLNRYLNKGVIWPDGSVGFTKELIGKVKSYKIEMYPNDHNPPHFHVKSRDGSFDACFTLDDCSLLKGEVGRDDYKRIRAFFKDSRDDLWMYWNEKVAR